MILPPQLVKNRRSLMETPEGLRKRGWYVWKPFGGHVYSYPDFSSDGKDGNEMAVAGLYGFVSLVIGALSFSVVETFVILALAFLDAESAEWSTRLPYHDTMGFGISGVNGWLAGHNLAQLFFKERRSLFCAGGAVVALDFVNQWLKGTKNISHACHFQTLGAGILSAVVLRNQVRSKPIQFLRKHSTLIVGSIFVVGFILSQSLKGFRVN